MTGRMRKNELNWRRAIWHSSVKNCQRGLGSGSIAQPTSPSPKKFSWFFKSEVLAFIGVPNEKSSHERL